MREILFRGKSLMPIRKLNQIGIKHQNGWVVGNLIQDKKNPWIVGDLLNWHNEYVLPEFWVKVRSETVGQYTGYIDINGRMIFENDLIIGKDFTNLILQSLGCDVEEDIELFIIKYFNGSFSIFDLNDNWIATIHDYLIDYNVKLEVIGNKFDDFLLISEMRRKNER